MIEIILCNAEYFDKMQNIPHFYFDDCQVFAVKRKKFIEKSCDKIWRGMKKSLPLHSLLRNEPCGGRKNEKVRSEALNFVNFSDEIWRVSRKAVILPSCSAAKAGYPESMRTLKFLQ